MPQICLHLLRQSVPLLAAAAPRAPALVPAPEIIQAIQPAVNSLGARLSVVKDAVFSLFRRACWPKTAVIDGSWTPPVESVSRT